jgi:hypothetical protein
VSFALGDSKRMDAIVITLIVTVPIVFAGTCLYLYSRRPGAPSHVRTIVTEMTRPAGAPCPRCGSQQVALSLTSPQNLVALPVYAIYALLGALIWIGLESAIPIWMKCRRCRSKFASHT